MTETIVAFQARAQQSFRQRLERKDAELSRAIAALRLEAAKLREQRERGFEVLKVLEEIRESFRGKGASSGAYVAILALHRVRRVLGYPEEDLKERGSHG